MLWFYATIASYFFFAVSALYDRYILTGPLRHPRSLAFYVGITGIFATGLVPLAFIFPAHITFFVPSLYVILLSFTAGGIGVAALATFYRAVFEGHVSTAVPSVGALVPVFTLLTGLLFAEENINITVKFIAALIFLIAGTVLLSSHSKKGFKFSRRNLRLILMAAAFFGISFGLTKISYNNIGLVNGFIWMRWGGFLASASLLLWPSTRHVIFKDNPIAKRKVYSPIIFGKVAGGGGFIFQQYAIFAGNFMQVPVINALAGVQYFFILLLAWIVSLKNKKILKEELSKASLPIRIAGIVAIGAGTWLLFV